VDSSRGGVPLPGAVVFLEGAGREVTADEQGRFEMAARVDGEYAVSFRHARLDSLGIRPDAVPVRLARGQRAALALAVPPESAVVARLCPDGVDQSGRVMVGRVQRPGAAAPAPGVEVRAEWQAVTGGARLLAGSDFRATATTDTAGAYVLCGIPVEERVAVRAVSVAGAGPMVILDFNQTGVWIDQQQYRSLPGRIWIQHLEVPR
jgi:hypothetical protein